MNAESHLEQGMSMNVLGTAARKGRRVAKLSAANMSVRDERLPRMRSALSGYVNIGGV